VLTGEWTNKASAMQKTSRAICYPKSNALADPLVDAVAVFQGALLAVEEFLHAVDAAQT
jgi:hypothetical protein